MSKTAAPKHRLGPLHWIDDNKKLAAYCTQWQSQAYISLDTEFMRAQTYYPVAGLIQVSDQHGSYFIDPLSITNWQAFAELLAQPLLQKVVHAMGEDIEVLQKLMPNLVLNAFVDTQIAAALLNLGAQVGLQRLIKQVLNINLDKNQTRSNWLQRPLSSQQVYYAQEDVYYLYKLYPRLIQQLEQTGRASWLLQECQQLLDRSCAHTQLNDYYKRIKLAWKLNLKQQFLLKQLAIWREQKVQRLDIIRSKFIQDESLWRIAKHASSNIHELQLAGVKAAEIEAYGTEILDLVKQAQSMDSRYWGKPLALPLNIYESQVYKALRTQLKDLAQQQNIAPEVLMRKQELQALVRAKLSQKPCHLPDFIQGWRYHLMRPLLEQWLMTPL